MRRRPSEPCDSVFQGMSLVRHMYHLPVEWMIEKVELVEKNQGKSGNSK